MHHVTFPPSLPGSFSLLSPSFASITPTGKPNQVARSIYYLTLQTRNTKDLVGVSSQVVFSLRLEDQSNFLNFVSMVCLKLVFWPAWCAHFQDMPVFCRSATLPNFPDILSTHLCCSNVKLCPTILTNDVTIMNRILTSYSCIITYYCYTSSCYLHFYTL